MRCLGTDRTGRIPDTAAEMQKRSSWSAESGMVLLCAFGGIRLQNGAGKIVSGMSGLEKKSGRRGLTERQLLAASL